MIARITKNPVLVALSLISGFVVSQAALAQTTVQQTTTTVQPTPPYTVGTPMPHPVVEAPPVGTLSTTTMRKSVSPDGSHTEQQSSTYRNTQGVAEDSVTRTTTTAAPVLPAITTRTTTTTDQP